MEREVDEDETMFMLLIGIFIGAIGYYLITRYNTPKQANNDDYNIYFYEETLNEKPR